MKLKFWTFLSQKLPILDDVFHKVSVHISQFFFIHARKFSCIFVVEICFLNCHVLESYGRKREYNP